MNSYSTYFHPAPAGQACPQGCSQKRGCITVSHSGHCCSQQSHLCTPRQARNQDSELQVKPQFPSHPKGNTPISRHQGDTGQEGKAFWYFLKASRGETFDLLRAPYTQKPDSEKILVAFKIQVCKDDLFMVRKAAAERWSNNLQPDSQA